MLTFLNVVLLFVATVATLAAFGGDTWDKGKKNEAFLRRVRLRGWISLACLFVALILGVSKEFVSKAEDQKKSDDAAKEKLADKAIAEANEISLSDKLGKSQTDLAAARSELDKMMDVAVHSQKELGKVQTNLDAARADLGKAAITNLINITNASRKT